MSNPIPASRSARALTIWLEASAATIVVAVFGAWVTVGGTSVPGTDSGNHGWIALAAALAAAAVAWFRRGTRSAGVYAAILGAAALAAVAYDRKHLADAIGGGRVVEAAAHPGWGLDLAFAGSLSLVLAGAAWATIVTALPWSWLAPTPGPSLGPSAIESTTRENRS